MQKSKSLMLTKSAIFAAVLCVISPISIMIGTIPVTFSIFALILTASLLNQKEAIYAVLVYLLLGLCSLPVFSGASGGIGAFMGPTGGYLFSYPLVVYVAGKRPKIIKNPLLKSIVPSLCALMVCYLFGSVWYMITVKVSFLVSVSVCVLPFILLDIIKVFAACILANLVKRRFSFL